MGKNYTYVDNSNVYIEGSRVSAVQKRMEGAETMALAQDNKVTDHDWHLDYGALHEFACGSPEQVGAANLWGSPPPGDSFWKMVKSHNFEVTTYDRNAANKEKRVDVAIAHKMTKDAYSGVIKKGEDEITLVAGDQDYVPVVEDLVKEGFIVHVVFWAHAHRDLRNAATKFVSLDRYLDLLTKPWAPKPPTKGA